MPHENNFSRRKFMRLAGAFLGNAMAFTAPAFSFGKTAERKIVALTFDDGPKPRKLPGILEELAVNGCRAAFFFLGSGIAVNRWLVRKTREENHELASHGFSHERIDRLAAKYGNDFVIKSEVRRTENEYAKIFPGFKPKFFRPPFWMITKPLEEAVVKEGYFVNHLGFFVPEENVFSSRPKLAIGGRPARLRDVNSLDYEYAEGTNRGFNPEAVIRNVLKQVEAREKTGTFGHILVFHELDASREALKKILPELKKRGYEFLALGDFLNYYNAAPNKQVQK